MVDERGGEQEEEKFWGEKKEDNNKNDVQALYSPFERTIPIVFVVTSVLLDLRCAP